jgi:hypothetical protein
MATRENNAAAGSRDRARLRDTERCDRAANLRKRMTVVMQSERTVIEDKRMADALWCSEKSDDSAKILSLQGNDRAASPLERVVKLVC